MIFEFPILYVSLVLAEVDVIQRGHTKLCQRDVPEVCETLFCPYYMFLLSFFVNPGLGNHVHVIYNEVYIFCHLQYIYFLMRMVVDGSEDWDFILNKHILRNCLDVGFNHSFGLYKQHVIIVACCIIPVSTHIIELLCHNYTLLWAWVERILQVSPCNNFYENILKLIKKKKIMFSCFYECSVSEIVTRLDSHVSYKIGSHMCFVDFWLSIFLIRNIYVP